MVRTSQNLSILPASRTAEMDTLLISMHEADSAEHLARAVFELVDVVIPNQFLIMLFRPLEFELPCRYSPVKYKPVVDAYMAENHKHDLWLARSPVNPAVTVVRHGDYTPLELLHDSHYYHNVLRPLDSEFGASVVAWREETWLATLTIMRNKAQGEFTDPQMEELKVFHPHFASVIRRMAKDQESRLVGASLSRFMAKLPNATVVLDWDLKPIHFNAAALELCMKWQKGLQASVLKSAKQLRLPLDIRKVIERIRDAAISSRATDTESRTIQEIIENRMEPRFKAKIEYLPSRSLSLSKGTFLITFNEDIQGNASLNAKMQKLSPRERECAMLVAAGMQNAEIARQLGKSHITVRNQLTSIYRKLGVNSRHKLIAALVQQKP